MLFGLASHFVPHCGVTKNGQPIMNSKSAAWIQPPVGCDRLVQGFPEGSPRPLYEGTYHSLAKGTHQLNRGPFCKQQLQTPHVRYNFFPPRWPSIPHSYIFVSQVNSRQFSKIYDNIYFPICKASLLELNFQPYVRHKCVCSWGFKFLFQVSLILPEICSKKKLSATNFCRTFFTIETFKKMQNL